MHPTAQQEIESIDIFTVPEAAQFLRCGPKAVRRLCRLKKLAHAKIDLKGTIRISRTAIDQFLAGGGR